VDWIESAQGHRADGSVDVVKNIRGDGHREGAMVPAGVSSMATWVRRGGDLQQKGGFKAKRGEDFKMKCK